MQKKRVRSVAVRGENKAVSSHLNASIERSVDLCNESAALLCNGQAGKAISKLSSSLSTMKQMLASSDTRATLTTTAPTKDDGTEPPVGPYPLQRAFLRTSNYYVYNQCMVASAGSPTYNAEHITMYSAGIVINSALAYHRLGISHNQSWLWKAEMMYRMTLQLLSAMADQEDEIVLSMRILIVNNLAHVHHERSEHDKVVVAIKTLASLLTRLPESSTLFTETDKHRFAMNVGLWGASAETAAAA